MSRTTAAFRRLLTHRVELYKEDRDGAGDTVKTLVATIPAFIEHGRRLIKWGAGEEYEARAILFLAGDAPFDPDHPNWSVRQISPTEGPFFSIQGGDALSIDDPRTGIRHHYELPLR